MKKLALVLVLALAAPTFAFAGSPDKAMDKDMERMMNCVVCKPFGEYPQLHPAMRMNVLDTSNGFVAVMAVSDEKLASTFQEAWGKCEANIDTAKKLKPAEYSTKLCGCCEGMFTIMARPDVKVEEFDIATGHVTLASSTTKEGVKALHDHASNQRKMIEKMMMMSKEMPSGE